MIYKDDIDKLELDGDIYDDPDYEEDYDGPDLGEYDD